ncbi:MAG: ATP-binding protein [Clostridia bacterium]|nr:ATP-binding protein [Clostridia bacterium]
MLRRKIDDFLKTWKETPDRKPLYIKGVRQCGKTFSIMRFAKENYKYVVYINFVENPETIPFFDGSLNPDDLIKLISTTKCGQVPFVPGETIIIFDEAQKCPDARTSLKFFKEDGRFDVICTGSLLGISGYGKPPRSVPVGYETIMEMRPLDFEEFLWACGISEQIIQGLKNNLTEEKPVHPALNSVLQNLFLDYAVVGGMPKVVQTFLDTKQMPLVLSEQRLILDEYRDDMVKYADKKISPLIRECFNSIPKQLSKENKKFQYSVVRQNGKGSQFLGCIQWIEDAGIISRCHNLFLPELPLDGNAIDDVFKVYMNDTGLFVSMLDEGTQQDILQGNLYGYKGAIMENLIAGVLTKMDRKLYYFHKDSGLEVDFVMRYKGGCHLVEVKAVTGNTKSSKTVLAHPEKYHVDGVIKLGMYNIGRQDRILTLPMYMSFLLTEY